MAKRIEFNKFLIIRCTAQELADAVGSAVIVCDFCGMPQTGNERGYYIAVLNQWYCEDCDVDWTTRAEWYPEDADIERKNFEFYAPQLGVKCQ